VKSAINRSLPALQSSRLLDQVRERIHYLHYSIRTEQAYVHWVRAFVRFHRSEHHPAEMGAAEVEAFLSWLANDRHVSVSTNKQALSALVFLYKKVLGLDLPWLDAIGGPKRRVRLPEVLTHHEVARLLLLIEPEHRTLAQLLYGTGMRLMEGIRLRVKDIDFERRAVLVREGKGGEDRVVMLPPTLVPALREQLARARLLWADDRAAGCAGVFMPDALDRKYPRGRPRGHGSGSFPTPTCRPTRAAARCVVITSSTRPSSAASSAPSSVPASCARPRRTRSAIPLPRTCCRPAMTSAPCRSSSVMPTSARP
jgi:integrase